MKNGELLEIFKQDMTIPFNTHIWNNLTISIMDTAMFVVLNKKDVIVDNLIHDSFGDLEGGSVGFGSNNIISEFSDVNLSITMPDAFLIGIQNLLRGIEAKKAAQNGEAELEALESLESTTGGGAGSESESISAEDILSYVQCIEFKNMDQRTMSCTNDLQIDTAACPGD